MAEFTKLLNKHYDNLFPINMTASNPVVHSPRNNIQGNDLPTKVRAFKASQISTLPSIHKSIVSGGLTFTSTNSPTKGSTNLMMMSPGSPPQGDYFTSASLKSKHARSKTNRNMQASGTYNISGVVSP